MEDFFKELDLTEEDVKKTKRMYEEYLLEHPEESKLNLEDFTYTIFELGFLPYEIKKDLERIIEIKKHLNINYHKEEFILKHLNLTIEEELEEIEEELSQGVVNISSKVNGIVKTIYEDRIEEFYFKFSVPDGYKLKLVKGSSIVANIYVNESEVKELLAQLHIKTESIVHKVFKLDLEKEAYFKRMLSSIHDLGMIKQELTAIDVTKEELISMVNLLKSLTNDNDLASLDVETIQQEELYNIVHRKHLEYYSKFKDIILTELNSAT